LKFEGTPQVNHFGLNSVQRHRRSGEGKCSTFLQNAPDCSRTPRSLKKISENEGFVDPFVL